MHKTVVPAAPYRARVLGSYSMPITVPQKNAVDDFHYIARRILLQKGTTALPRLVSQACAGMTTVEQIVLVMQELTRRGLGQYNPYYVDGEKCKKIFFKKPLSEIRTELHQFGITEFVYQERYMQRPAISGSARKSSHCSNSSSNVR